jgi:hypothetical protein
MTCGTTFDFTSAISISFSLTAGFNYCANPINTQLSVSLGYNGGIPLTYNIATATLTGSTITVPIAGSETVTAGLTGPFSIKVS